MTNLTRAERIAVGCLLLIEIIFSSSQQVYASPSVYFYGYKLTTNNTVLQLLFGVKGILSSDQVHVEINVYDSVSKISRVYPSYYQGPGNFTATVTSPPGQVGQPFKAGGTYYATIHVFVPSHGGVDAIYEKDTFYTILP
jgi:hypothetical protein